jgi:hypothetical protein
MSREALSLARELAHPFSVAYALMFGSTTHLWRGEAQAARDHAEAVISLCREQGFSSRLATGTFCRGQALTERVIGVCRGLGLHPVPTFS